MNSLKVGTPNMHFGGYDKADKANFRNNVSFQSATVFFKHEGQQLNFPEVASYLSKKFCVTEQTALDSLTELLNKLNPVKNVTINLPRLEGMSLQKFNTDHELARLTALVNKIVEFVNKNNK
jgi:hypothetical protein